jgi:hypothetical protein
VRRSAAQARFLHRGATPAWADARAKVDIEPSRVRDRQSSDRYLSMTFFDPESESGIKRIRG